MISQTSSRLRPRFRPAVTYWRSCSGLSRAVRDYWEDFCGEVLRAPLHHGPTRGGDKQRTKFRDCYSATLRSYRVHFAEDPPADIWPTVEQRFRSVSAFRRVDEQTHWVIRKPQSRLPWLAAAGAAIALAGPLSASSSGTKLGGIEFPAWIVAVLVPIGILLAGVCVYFSDSFRCSKCKRYWAMNPTENKDDGKKEWVCSHCGHSEWRVESTESGCGGCGCGG